MSGDNMRVSPEAVTELGLEPHVGNGGLQHHAGLRVPVLDTAAVIERGVTRAVQPLHDDGVTRDDVIM